MPPGGIVKAFDIVEDVGADWNPIPNEANVKSMRSLYSRLRATMERVVEKELLGGVVLRSRVQIVTGRIDYVFGIPESEGAEVGRLIQRCHEVTDAHDVAPSKHAIVPDPDALKENLKATERLIDAIKIRHKAAGLK